MTLRSRITILLLALLPGLLQAQEQAGWFPRAAGTVGRMLTTPSRVFDPDYVFQSPAVWMVSADADLIWTGIRLDSRYSTTASGANHLQVSKRMRNEFFKKVGLGFSYGSLHLGYSLEIDRHGTERNRYFNLSFVRPSFGISCQYYTIHEFLEGEFSLDWLDGTYPFSSTRPGEMKHLVVDAFYFFNPTHFSYKAAAGRHLIQRRSAGSWMALARYSQGDYRDDIRDEELDISYDRIGRYRTGAFSLGGGYSFNWVPLHRDPAPGERSLKGLRNLVINATLIPYVSLYEHLGTVRYHYMPIQEALQRYLAEHPEMPETSERTEAAQAYRLQYAQEGQMATGSRFFRPSLNVAARAGICFSRDRFTLSVTATATRYSFRDIETGSEGNKVELLSTCHGSFYDISTRFSLGYRF